MGNRLRLAAVLAALSAAASAELAAQPAASQPVLIELFTSQGCSSCPPADKLLGELSRDPNVIALSFPVTYWDYLGWKDTFARPEFTSRQRSYARSLGADNVYTPQAVVNGLKDCVGSSRRDVQAAIADTGAAMRISAVSVRARLEGGRVIVDAGSAPAGSSHKNGKIYVAALIPSEDVKIGRGENAGHTVTYTNVVRKLTEAGVWQGQSTAYSIPLAEVTPVPGDKLVVFLQADRLGPIVGAVKIGG